MVCAHGRLGILFLLFPLTLNLNFVSSDRVIQASLLRLIPIPLAVLPIACNYALFRTQLLGTASMLSRQAMRLLLWILLASVFVFSAIIGLRFISTFGVSADTVDYIYAGLLVMSLALFPLVWSKVRDVGDQVFYGDFYRYNHSLRDLSAALTRLQGIEQISTFMLPRLAALLNPTETALLLRAVLPGIPAAGQRHDEMLNWRIYHHIETRSTWASRPKEQYSDERLVRIANLALTHQDQNVSEPMVLDGMLLLALYDGSRCSCFLCLGPKFNLEPYSKQDSSFLSTLASQLSVLEVNSRYFEQAQSDAQQLVALSHRVVSAQEEERRHLALELHDEALQQAMLVVRQLSDAGTMAEVAEVMPLARSVEVSLRRTCLQLRPPLVDELGLEEAFHWLARQTEEHSEHRLQIEVSCDGSLEPRPPANVELALYRVGQEALSNVSKYARASRWSSACGTGPIVSQKESELRPQPITIVLVDDHTMMREGTRRLLEEDPDLKIIGEAQDGDEALPLCRSLKPRVVVLDIAMKTINGFGVARSLLREGEGTAMPGILVLTAYDQLAYVQAMLRLGVKGYWLKSARGSEIRQAVHEVAEGRRSLSPEVRRLLLDEESHSLATPAEPLTARELEVLRLVVQGTRNSEIRQSLSISVKTVETHLTSIYGKLGVQSRAEAIALAQKQGLLLTKR